MLLQSETKYENDQRLDYDHLIFCLLSKM